MNPRPESRIGSLEKRATTVEAAIEELSSDIAEELKVVQQKQQGLFEHVQNGFWQAHDFVQERFADINKRLDKIESTMATKDDVRRLDGRLDEILQLLQKKLGE